MSVIQSNSTARFTGGTNVKKKKKSPVGDGEAVIEIEIIDTASYLPNKPPNWPLRVAKGHPSVDLIPFRHNPEKFYVQQVLR